MVDTLALVELTGLIAALALSWLALRGRRPFWRPAAHCFARLARRRRLAACLVGLLAAIGSAATSLLVYPTDPYSMDAFAYLLAADTFSHRRATNPTHPLWLHFETFQVIHQPTYMAKYPPGQGLMLALGQVLLAEPLAGVWLGMGLCAGAVCWMLQGWLPPRWALLGGLLAAGRLTFSAVGFGFVGYWGNSHWGGALAAFGGALVLGALRRLVQRPSICQAGLLGLGLVVLANSRPYEGLLLALPALALLAGWLVGPGRAALARVALPLGLVLATGAVAMGWYNARVTGDPLRLPYQVHESAYAVAPLFLWQPLRPEPAYNSSHVRTFYTHWAAADYREHDSAAAIVRLSAGKLQGLGKFFLGLTLTVPLVALLWVGRDRWFRFALAAAAFVLGGMLLLTGVFPHYAAPITGLVYLVVVQALRQLRAWRWQGRTVGRIIAAGVVLNSAVLCVAAVAHARVTFDPSEYWSQDRAAVLTRLKNTPGRHLVLVRYRPDHQYYREWVYNAADIDGSKVVWARERGGGLDRQLLGYYRTRRVWLLEADTEPPRLTPYPTTANRDAARGER
jgi:hypothetical protein